VELEIMADQPARFLEDGHLIGLDEGGVGRGEVGILAQGFRRAQQGQRNAASRVRMRGPVAGVKGTAIWSLG
jgi:hypothetical protein